MDANTKITAGVAYSQSELEFGEGPNSYLTNASGQKIYNGAAQLPNGDILQLTGNNSFPPYSLVQNPFLGYLPEGEQIFRAYSTVQTKVDDISIKSSLSYMWDHFWYVQSAPLASVVVDPGAQPAVPGSLISNPSYRVLYNLYVEKPLTSWDVLTVGIQAEHDELVAEQKVIFPTIPLLEVSPAPQVITASAGRTPIRCFSGTITNLLNNKLHLYVGARRDWWSTAGYIWSAITPNTPTNTPGATTYPGEFVRSFSPKASLRF